MDFNLSLNLEKIKKDAQHDFEERVSNITASQLRELCRLPVTWHNENKGGPFYEMIKETLETKFLSTESQSHIAKHIDKSWERIMEEELDKALHLAAEHKARKIAFELSGIKNPREVI